ncbi:muramoyltetrapeptide carboxypeptidase [Burkholderia sp. WAC0059]|uniref:muramoyltetrapeptide carboxypeptidase n=1 Tax=Burkholderia sp. WAC0059 TaxID=2066022 RepID=UPI000C7E9622|nr:muramoyltetrapeptide carboxypeptidase [Burkholderia sp. WAC0059]PLZ03953.1 muramoyltetrapeptide carboxypeptidase [Burkholderia sp. WAC0059]
MSAHRTIQLIAPSGYPPDPAVVQRGIARLREEGHQVVGLEATERRYQRFAGTDSQRAAELNRFADPSRSLPDIALAVRGGYGAVRILHGLDYAGLQRRLAGRPIAFVGHSDFTAIQLALYSQAGLTTFGGPMLLSDFGAETLNAFTVNHFWNALTSPSFTLKVDAPQVQSANVSGVLWGGNLSILASLVGTPFMPWINDGILFIEDVNEQPFRIERMIYQLHLSGIIARQRALLIGDFSGGKSFDYDNGYTLQEMIEQVRSVVGVPVITGLPFGHVPELVTLPFGGNAELQANPQGFELQVSGYPHLS